MADLVIRGATIVDGLGNEPRRADLAVKNGKIVAIGEIKGQGSETIDADGLTLADSNEEGANLLALQTRQQLSTTALSLASQASQAVLRLF